MSEFKDSNLADPDKIGSVEDLEECGQETDHIRALINDLHTISQSHIIKKADETYKDKVVNFNQHFHQRCSKLSFNQNFLPTEIDTSYYDFTRIEVVEMSKKNSDLFSEHQEACKDLLAMALLRKKYLFPEHSDCK